MIDIPTPALLKIHKFIGPRVLYLGRTYFEEIQELKNTFKKHPIKFTYDKSIQNFRRSPHWPSRVRLGNEYYRKNTLLALNGKQYIGRNLWQAERILKKQIQKKTEIHTQNQHYAYPYSDEVYNVSEIRGYNFKLESDKERLKLYQNLWGRYY
jgi:hypothetical protein